jgi:hypothetical protein
MTEVRAEKVNEAVAYILQHSVSQSEANTKLRGRGFTEEAIALVWATVEEVRAAAQPKLAPKAEPKVEAAQVFVKRNFVKEEEEKRRVEAPKAEQEFFSAPMQPEVEAEPVGEPDPALAPKVSEKTNPQSEWPRPGVRAEGPAFHANGCCVSICQGPTLCPRQPRHLLLPRRLVAVERTVLRDGAARPYQWNGLQLSPIRSGPHWRRRLTI